MAETLLVPLITEQGGKDIQHEEYEDILSGAVGSRDRPPAGRARCRVSSAPGTLRAVGPEIARRPTGGLDQQTLREQNSVNSIWECLKAIDTHRDRHPTKESPLIAAPTM